VICLAADVCIELRQRIELPTAKLIGARINGGEKDNPNSQEFGGKVAHLCNRLVLELAETMQPLHLLCQHAKRRPSLSPRFNTEFACYWQAI